MHPLRNTILAHIAAWLLFVSLVLGFVYRGPAGVGGLSKVPIGYLILFFAVFITFFYLNSLLLLPALYLQKKYYLYFCVIASLLIIVLLVRPFDRLMSNIQRGAENNMSRSGSQNLLPPRPANNYMRSADTPFRQNNQNMSPMPFPNRPRRGGGMDIMSAIVFIAVWSISTALFIIRQWRLTEQRALLAETEKANAELSFLKAQINPHFLFNTLNNIYSLAISKNEHTAESILKLSNIMRYVTDDIREDFVMLEHEITCMRDYIDLQKLRLGKKMQVDFNVSGQPGSHRIVPLVLMTFIENVFKYGISNHEPSAITISLDITASEIHFFCRNKVFKANGIRERTGIGISNTRQRIEHLYAGKHNLTIEEASGYFMVDLKLFS